MRWYLGFLVVLPGLCFLCIVWGGFLCVLFWCFFRKKILLVRQNSVLDVRYEYIF